VNSYVVLKYINGKITDNNISKEKYIINGGEEMNNDIVFKVIKRSVFFSLIFIGLCFFLFKEPMPIINGYIFGGITSILNFKLLHNTINKAICMAPHKANMHSTIRYTVRYIIYFIVLIIAALAPYLNFISTIIGLFLVKNIILGSAILDKEFR